MDRPLLSTTHLIRGYLIGRESPEGKKSVGRDFEEGVSHARNNPRAARYPDSLGESSGNGYFCARKNFGEIAKEARF